MATANAPDRLRQIAILIASVDSIAARQLLLHLPTDKARQVRELAAQLGPVSAEERRRVLADFQRTASTTSANTHPTVTSNHGTVVEQTLPPERVFSLSDRGAGVLSELESSNTAPDSAAAWTRMSVDSLIRFVRGERPAVIAVVIGQLLPETGVQVLRSLPAEVNRDVLLRLSCMQEIDAESMAAIDEHLSQRLTEYENYRRSELENSRRMQALLQAAPFELRGEWLQILNPSSDSGRSSTPQVQVTQAAQPIQAQQPVAQPDIKRPDLTEYYGSSVISTADVHDTVDLASEPSSRKSGASSPDSSQTSEPSADILPFPAPSQRIRPVDRSLVQMEFEQILDLPPHVLATLLSSTESEVVLLALAGATPPFMKRFCEMLDRRDAKALQARLQKIGPIQLRDVDEAQWRIVDNAARLNKSRRKPEGVPMARAA